PPWTGGPIRAIARRPPAAIAGARRRSPIATLRALVEAEQGPRACAGVRPEASAGPANATLRIARTVRCRPLADAAPPPPPWTGGPIRAIARRPPAAIAGARRRSPIATLRGPSPTQRRRGLLGPAD